MPSSLLSHRPAPMSTDGWANRIPGLRVAIAGLLLAVVALGVAWAGASLAPADTEPASTASAGGGAH